MNILYIGDIMARPGIETVEAILPKLVDEHNVDFVIAQSENVSDGRSMLPADMEHLQSVGVDFFTGGNHTPKRSEIHPLLEDEHAPVIGPANMHSCPGRGWKLAEKNGKKVLVISLLGETFSMSHPAIEKDNPLHAIDDILRETSEIERDAVVVNFHGDFSSEKRIIGYYLDGRVTAVVGDHWHVPTADAMILPAGTAHMTDVGMCGTMHSSLGVSLESVIPRWRDGIQTRNEMETNGPRQFNALLIRTKSDGYLAESILPIQIVQ